MLTGTDVSQWQTNLGLNDLDFVVAKATQGTGFRDPMFYTHVQTAHARGQLVFAYHFGERGEGIAGALNFLATIAPVIHLLSGVAYDCEFQDGAQSIGPAYADAVAWNLTVAARTTLTRFLYTAAYYWVSVLGNPPPLPGTRLWWAHLNQDANDPNPHGVANATTKPPYPDLSYPDYAIRQVGWKAIVGGVGPCDIDISWLTRQQLAGGSTPPVPEGDDIMAQLTSQQASDLLKAIGGAVMIVNAKVDTLFSTIVHGDSNGDGKPDHYGLQQVQGDFQKTDAALETVRQILAEAKA